jgi:hypothetical protein
MRTVSSGVLSDPSYTVPAADADPTGSAGGGIGWLRGAALIERAGAGPVAAVLRDDPPVPATRRRRPDGEIVLVDLRDAPFGAGPHACPGREHALALVEGARR